MSNDRLNKAASDEGTEGAWNQIAKAVGALAGAQYNMREAESASDRGDEAEREESARWTNASLDSAEKALDRARDRIKD
ncbi:hypothetical protein [Corallococcus praedator]|uniref:hypothetical protein n=1 Tax=Corallococcus praedator TaxID=2316724 RepID=UPI0011C41A1F|nr:hypothetical protein [Corallococcus praedator]